MSPGVQMIVTSVADFFLASGGTISGAMIQAGLQEKAFVMPNKMVWLAALVAGVIAFWSHIKASLTQPPK